MCAEEASIIIRCLSNQKLLRLVGRTHANIILTLSRPIRVSESYFINSLLSKAPQGKKSNRTTILLSFILSSFFVEMEIDVLLKRAR